MTALTKEQILTAGRARKVERVPVPELGGDVCVRGLTGTDRDAFEASLFNGEGEERKFSAENVRAKLLVRCIVDEEGKRLFGDDEHQVLGDCGADALDALYDVAQRLSGIARKDLERAVKN